jgi:hypothetical protein
VTTIVISNNQPYNYGVMTNQTIAALVSTQGKLERLKEAIATAASGYQGVPGTQFEMSPSVGPVNPPNLFGVSPSDTPGEQGSAYSYAAGRLGEEWAKFWAAAEPFIAQLDNGTGAFP